MNTDQKEQMRKQWLALNPHSTPEQFEAAYPALLELNGEQTGTNKIPVRNRNERSMADVIRERREAQK